MSWGEFAWFCGGAVCAAVALIGLLIFLATRDKRPQCGQCGRRFNKEWDLSQHTRAKHEKPRGDKGDSVRVPLRP